MSTARRIRDMNSGSNRNRSAAERQGIAGMTMVELMIVMVILVVALLGFVFGLGVTVQDVSASKQSYVALNAARSKIEEMKGQRFRSLYTDFGPGSGSDSFVVTYEEEGKTFTLESPSGGDAGQITFCVDETAISGDYGWVSTYDLNGDGDSTDADVSLNYKLLPVVIRVSWVDVYGSRDIEVKTILFDPKYPG
jgi:type II secretory pathway pseudopilin PulG